MNNPPRKEPNRTQTLDQRRAAHAWKAITDLKSEDAAEYGREAKKLPVRIQTAGLGQALAFLCAKAKDRKPSLKKLHEDLGDWVIKKRPIRATDPQSLLLSVVHGDADFFRRATDEALAYLQWLNRFAEAEGIAGEEGGEQ